MKLRVGQWRRRASCVLVWSALMCATRLSVVFGAERIIEQEPYDQVVLKGDARVFKLLPLDLAKREPLSGKDPDDVLVVRLAERPEQKYQVNWSAIERVELFEELVLREAARLVAGKQYEEAHEYFVFLHRRDPEFPGLSAARQSCLLSEARHWLDRNRAPQALVVLLELWEQNHDYPELPQVLGTAVDHMVAQYFAAGQDAAARELVEQLAARYPDHEVVVARRQLLVARAETFLQTARVAMDEQRWRESHDAIQMSLSIWPDLKDSQRLAQELNTRYPLIRVGVRDLDDASDAAGWAPTWSTLRHRRLTAGGTVSAPDDRATNSPLEADAEAQVRRPASYRKSASTNGEQQFVAEVGDVAEQSQQPREIVERRFDNTIDALRALDQRQILVFDRVAPWELAIARAHPQVELVRYAEPTVHMLVPNPRSPLMTSGLARRAVSAAIDRERILTEVLGDGGAPAGEVLSGPFPRGYAYDETMVIPRHDPRLAIALLRSGAAELARDRESRPITLVCARSDMARRAAGAIQEQLQIDGLGFRVELRETTAAAHPGSDSSWDLWLIEWPAMDPARDAPTLLAGAGGLGRADPELEGVWKQLAQVDGPDQASPLLRTIHGCVNRQWAVIPLWQFHEHALVHRTLQGVGEQPGTLYQQVERWQVINAP